MRCNIFLLNPAIIVNHKYAPHMTLRASPQLSLRRLDRRYPGVAKKRQPTIHNPREYIEVLWSI